MSNDWFGKLNPVTKSKVARNYTDNTWGGMVSAGLNTFSNFAFGDQGPMFAKVLRVEPHKEPPPGSWAQNFQPGEELNGQVWVSVKARIPSIHSYLPDPLASGQNADEANLQINMHHTFTSIKPVDVNSLPAPADIIQVDFMDRVNLEYPVFIRNISQGFLNTSAAGARQAFTDTARKANFKAQLINGELFEDKQGITTDPCAVVTTEETPCDTRDVDEYRKILKTTFDAGIAPPGRYIPKPWYGSGTKNATFCNFFVKDVTDTMGVGVRYSVANDIIEGLKKEPAGWKNVNAAEAAKAAARGEPTIVGWIQPPDPKTGKNRPGHVAMMRPNGQVANVGSSNNINVAVSKAFPGLSPLHYFTHK